MAWKRVHAISVFVRPVARSGMRNEELGVRNVHPVPSVISDLSVNADAIVIVSLFFTVRQPSEDSDSSVVFKTCAVAPMKRC